jgi:hypothetical protein
MVQSPGQANGEGGADKVTDSWQQDTARGEDSQIEAQLPLCPETYGLVMDEPTGPLCLPIYGTIQD